jgi:hypothetical protein
LLSFKEQPVENSDIIHDCHVFHDLAVYGGARALLILPWMEGNREGMIVMPSDVFRGLAFFDETK